MTQAEQIREALDAAGITAYQLAKQLQISESFIYNTLASRTNITNQTTLTAMADIIPIDVDQMYIASGRIPPDVSSAILSYPQLIQVVRNLVPRLANGQ